MYNQSVVYEVLHLLERAERQRFKHDRIHQHGELRGLGVPANQQRDPYVPLWIQTYLRHGLCPTIQSPSLLAHLLPAVQIAA